MRDGSGFTLIEVIVSLLLLEVCVIGIAGMLTLSSRTLRRAESLESVVADAEGVLDSLRALRSPGAGAKSTRGGSLTWSIDADGEIALIGATDEGATVMRVQARSSAR